MSEGLILPNPDETLDVWGEQLNQAIDYVNTKADQMAAEVSQIKANLPDVSGAVPASSVGVAGGLATLDGAGQIPLEQLGNINATSIGAAEDVHQHALADIPDLSRTLRSTPIFTVFNTTTNQWPASRASLTTDALRPVIWFGGTALPADAKPVVDAWIKTDTTQLVVTAAGGGTTTPPPTSGEITLATPTVTVNGSTYNITADFTNGSSQKTFAYIQLAVRGPGGTPSADTGYRNNRTLAAGEKLTLTGSADASVVGDWTVRIAYTEDGTTWINGPARTFTIATVGGGEVPPPVGDPGGTRTIPLIGRSGLPWNSGVFRGAGELTRANEFATWRNRPLDSITYFTGRTKQDDMNWRRSDLNSWPGYRIISVPAQQSGAQNFGSDATKIQFWKDWGTAAKNQGWNDGRTIVRLNWEANGDWYSWAWVKGGAALFVQTYKNVVNAIRSTAPNMIFNLTMNRGNVNGGINWQTQIYDPLIEHVDIVGLDWYDEWPNWRTQSGFNSSVNISMPNPGPANIAAWCRSRGKMMWLDEWGMSHRPEAGDAAGKDDPAGIGYMWNWLNANSDVVAGETFYEDYGTNNQKHGFMTGDNPLAAAAYRSPTRWGRS